MRRLTPPAGSVRVIRVGSGTGREEAEQPRGRRQAGRAPTTAPSVGQERAGELGDGDGDPAREAGEGREGPEGFVFSLVSLPVACRGQVAEQNENPLPRRGPGGPARLL